MNQLEQYRQVQIVKTSEVVLNAPPERVWPYLLDFSSFNDTFERIELLVGVQNSIGAISRLTKRQGIWWIPPYLVKIVHLDAGKQIVWKMYPEEGNEFSSFVDFSLRDSDHGTVFTIRSYRDQRLTLRTAQEETAAIQASIAASDRLHREMMFPNLKRLVEGGTTATR